MRISLLPMILCSLLTSTAFSQQWAIDMFDHTSHDFGIVARGAKVEHRFLLDNIYNEDIQIISVSSSCTCTSPSISKRVLKTYEKSEIVVSIDTINHRGRKDATIQVVLRGINHSFRANIQLQSYVFIRDDVRFEPGVVQFGAMNQGTPARKMVTVSRIGGQGTWRILSVQPTKPYYNVSSVERSRQVGRVVYDLWIALKPEAPVGYLKDFIMLVTNDQNVGSNRVSLAVEGVVVSELSAKPSPVPFGSLRTNEQIKRNLVVSGQSTFRILDVVGPDERYSFKTSEFSKKAHLIPVVFQADSRIGKLVGEIRVDTDFKGGKSVTFLIEGEVIPGGPDPVAPETIEESSEEESSEEESSEEESSGEESSEEESSEEESSEEESSGEESSGEKTSGEKTSGEESSGGPSLG